MDILGRAAFLRQTLTDFRTTGAIAPSSRFLARAMVKNLAAKDGIRVLEVGAGTGSFTPAIAKKIAGRGHLDACEINPELARHLENRLAKDKRFSSVRGRVTVWQGDVLSLKANGRYDAIISALPFNNFTAAEVKRFLEHFKTLLKAGGMLAFFEYVGIRKVQEPFLPKPERERLREIAKVVDEFAQEHQFDSEVVWLNLPPARVRHMRFGPRQGAGQKAAKSGVQGHDS